MSKEMKSALGVGAVAGAGIGAAGVGAVKGVGVVSEATRNVVAAGDQGWDEDGNFVCSAFMFNWRTREFFDGTKTRDIKSLKKISTSDKTVILNVEGEMQETKVNVGSSQRAELIFKLLNDMSAGTVYEPDTKTLLPTFGKRMRSITVTTLLRYAVRSLFYGFCLSGMIAMAIGDRRTDVTIFMTLMYVLIPMIFGISICHRLFRTVPEPKWSN